MPNVKLSDKTTRTAASITTEANAYFVGIDIDGSNELFKMQVPQLRTLLGIGGVSDGDKGDIVIGSAGTVYTIDSGVLSAYGRTLTVTANAAAARGVLGLGTSATLNVGTSANNVVQLDGTSKLPAVDGSQLTNLPGGGSAITALTGNVTASGPGSAVATIANSAVTYAKIQNVTATDKILGRSTAGAGVVEEITCTAAGRDLLDDANAAAQRTTLGLGTLATQSGTFSGTSSGTNTGDQTITLTGDVTGTGTGSFAATIAAGSVTNAKLATIATTRFKGRVTGGTGAVEDLTPADARTVLASDSGGGTTNFLRADATWAAPAGGGTPGGSNTQIQFNNSGAFGGSANLTWDGTNFQTTIGRSTSFQYVGSVGSAIRFNSAGNGVGVITQDDGLSFGRLCFGGSTSSFPAVKRNGSELQVRLADDSAFANLKADTVLVGDGTVGAPSLAFTSDADGTGTGLYRSAANEIAVAINGVRQINLSGATAGTGAIRLNNTYTDASNYERGVFRWSSNVLQIGTEAAGTGTARAVEIGSGATTFTKRMTISASLYQVDFHASSLANDYLTIFGGSISCFTNAVGATFQLLGSDTGLSGDMDFRIGNVGKINWRSTRRADGGASDVGLARSAAGVLKLTNGSTGGGAVELIEQTAPAAGSANTVRIYAEDNGAGKTRLMALFNTGAAQVLATEP